MSTRLGHLGSPVGRPVGGPVVVGVDGSESTGHALDWAVDEAVSRSRPLHLVHAVGNPTPAWTPAGVPDVRLQERLLAGSGQEVLEAAARRALARAPGLEVNEILDFADPRALLVQHSRDAALLVLGSHGRGPVRSVLLGSVGAAVARRAECPVVIHRPRHPGEVRHGVLVACDATAESVPVLEFAYAEASARGLPLSVLHCWWDLQSYAAGTLSGTLSGDGYWDGGGPGLERARLDLSESMAGLGERHPDVRASVTVVRGDPGTTILEASSRMDLVVVGTHHPSWARRVLLGSVSTAVLEHAHAAVAVVPLASLARA